MNNYLCKTPDVTHSTELKIFQLQKRKKNSYRITAAKFTAENFAKTSVQFICK